MIPASRNIGAGASNITTTDNILDINTTLGAATLTLPSIASWFDLKSKSGSIYDADGLRFTDVSGTAGTNNITFVAAAGDNVNGGANIIVNTNGASGVLTPNLENGAWEFSLVGSAAGTGLYDAFGIVQIDNIFVSSLNLVGLKNIYATESTPFPLGGVAINIGGTGTIIASISMPDLSEVYGDVLVYPNSLLTSFSAPSLTLITGYINISSDPLLSIINIPALVSVKGNGSGAAIYINGTAITTLDLSSLTTTDISSGLYITSNTSLTTVTLNPALNCTNIQIIDCNLTQNNVDDILAKTNAGGVTKVQIGYDTLVGTFIVGEVITGGTSGATAQIISDNGSQIFANSVVGNFVVSETITGGTSGATANSTGIDKATLDLSGGTNAAPSASGLVHAASLSAKGWSVLTN